MLPSPPIRKHLPTPLTCKEIIVDCKKINLKAKANGEENAGLSNHCLALLLFVAAISVAVVLACFNVAVETASSRRFSDKESASPGTNTEVLGARGSEVSSQNPSNNKGKFVISTVGKKSLVVAILINGAILAVIVTGLYRLYRYCSNKHNFDDLCKESIRLSTSTSSLLEKISEIDFYLKSIVKYVKEIDNDRNNLFDNEAKFLENLAKGLNKDAAEMLLNL